jgi:hypothetical protein
MAKTFKGYVPIEKPSFDLESPDGQNKITIHCIGMLPGSHFLDFMSSISESRPSEMAESIEKLLRTAIQPEDWGVFRSFIDDPANGISMDMLAEITGYLGEMYAKRPTKSPEPSSDGFGTTGLPQPVVTH